LTVTKPWQGDGELDAIGFGVAWAAPDEWFRGYTVANSGVSFAFEASPS
jgi:hypothetical protein